MYSSQSRPTNDQYHERDVAPLVAKERPTAEEAWSSGPARDLDAVYRLKNDQVASNRPSIGRRIFRSVIRFSIAVLIGIGARLPGSPTVTKQRRRSGPGLRRWAGCYPSRRRSRPPRLQLPVSWCRRLNLSRAILPSCGAA